MGRPPRLLQRTTDHQPVSVKQLAISLSSTAFQGKSLGVKVRNGSCDPALPLFAYALLIGIIGRRNLTRRNGC